MTVRQIVPVACAVLGLGLAACGGGDDGGGGDNLAIGQEAVVEHTQSSGGAGAPKTTIGVTVLKVRKGTQDELKAGGFTLDPEERTTRRTTSTRGTRTRVRGVKTCPRLARDHDGNLSLGTVSSSSGCRPSSSARRTRHNVPVRKEGERLHVFPSRRALSRSASASAVQPSEETSSSTGTSSRSPRRCSSVRPPISIVRALCFFGLETDPARSARL